MIILHAWPRSSPDSFSSLGPVSSLSIHELTADSGALVAEAILPLSSAHASSLPQAARPESDRARTKIENLRMEGSFSGRSTVDPHPVVPGGALSSQDFFVPAQRRRARMRSRAARSLVSF